MRRTHRKRPLVYSFFVCVILVVLGNEWLLIFKSSSLFLRTTTHDDVATTAHSSNHHDESFHFRPGRPESWSHCVGENFLKNSWVLKSCQFAHLCWDSETDAFTLYPTRPRRNTTLLSTYARSSSDMWTQNVSVSATLPAWIADRRHEWFPRIIDVRQPEPTDGYYELPASVVWVPMAWDPTLLQHPSSILFDVLLPLYTLTTLFGWQDRPILWTPVQNVSACFDSPNSCYPAELQPYLELLRLAPLSILHKRTTNRRRLCARAAAAGVGALSDHGSKRHGERPIDYQSSHNIGKGPMLWKFRQYVLQNAGMMVDETTTAWPARIVWATSGKTDWFATQSSYLQKQKDLAPLAEFKHIDLDQSSLREQISLAVQSTFWISRVGEASIPAFFMGRSGTLILYYDVLIAKTNRPAMLHWDLWNHASHLTVHWLSAATMDTPDGLSMLRQIIQLQLDSLQRDKEERETGSAVGREGTKPRALGHELTWVPHVDNVASSSRCLGDNFVSSQAPCYRSCEYQHLCLDVGQEQFQLVLSEKQQTLQESLKINNDDFRVVAVDLNQTLMEGRNVRFTQNEPWAPSVIKSNGEGYFSLPSDVLWVPYTLDASFAGNLGHFCWDFLLPFYTLLVMYGYDDDRVQKKRLVLTSLDDECRTSPKCGGLVRKFMPMMGITEIYSVAHLQINEDGSPNSVERICAPHGVAGMGMLTDHGSTRHGQTLDDYQRVQNAGRGVHFFAFRNFLIRNLGIDESTIAKRSRHGVLFSVNSSTSLSRRKSFAKQIAATRGGLNDVAFVSGVEFARFPLRDQIQAILQSSVLVSTAGGSTATAMFLPRHASLILYFSSDESFVGRSRKKDFPTMMDFDYWNNAAYLRVHWLPTGSMDEDFHLEFLVDLIRSELEQTERCRLDDLSL